LASRRLTGYFDVERSDVDEMNLVALQAQPACIVARPTTDIENRGRRWR
jgi:hypothetical protein